MKTRGDFGGRFVKRLIDVVASGIAILVLSPVLVVVAVAVAANLGRPVIFAQDRPGLGGRVFTLYKFRTMKEVDEHRGLTSDEDRLTGFGLKLRATSLDELPTLINVLRGDMSIVGPRPLLVRYLDRYTPEQSRRHDVRPGLTGLAQVSGRNALTWEQKFDFDLRYVEQHNLRMDIGIVVKTFLSVARRDGISGHGEATMPEFNPGHNH